MDCQDFGRLNYVLLAAIMKKNFWEDTDMRVVMINGSPNAGGCTYTGLKIMQERFQEQGIDSVIYQIGHKPVSGCISCGACRRLGRCAIDDMVNVVAEDMKTADGLVLGSAVHFASATGMMTAFLDRLFYSIDNASLRLKPGACVVSCRRGGASAAFDQLNKYFTIKQMPVVSSCYWNQIHGFTPEDVYADKEGVRTLQVLADNMAYLIRCRAAANLPLPIEPPPAFTSFGTIRE